MKFLNIVYPLALSFGILFSFSACGEKSTQHNANESTEIEAVESATSHGEGPAYASAYVCPMHCEGSGSSEAGTCPVCGMEYVALTTHTADGHFHEGAGEGAGEGEGEHEHGHKH